MLTQRVTKVFIFLLLLSPIYFSSQNLIEGIFLNSKDFQEHKISYQKTGNEKYSLKLHLLFHNSTIKLIKGEANYIFSKDSLFGFCNKQGTFRFYNQGIYKVLNPGDSVLLYSKTHLGGYKNTESVIDYFFSVDCNSIIYPLSIECSRSIYLFDLSLLTNKNE